MLLRHYPGSLLGEAVNPRSLLPIQVRLQDLHRIGQHRLKRKTSRPSKAERRQAAFEARRSREARRNKEERDWLRRSRDALRDDMLRQYRQQSSWRPPPEGEINSPYQQKRRRYDDNVQCGIFWDIENVNIKHDNFHPPAVAIEAIRDFAASVYTPIFQAYMTRDPTPTERRVHAIYAQLGVSFIQCPDLGKDTADKKIISDMWKFYADKSQSGSQIRIVLITGDRDFADAIGQLRNFGVEMRMLTGNSITTAPVYDDYTIGMRVLPLLGVIEAKAEEGYAYVHQGPNGKYVSRMRDKQEQAWLAETEESEITKDELMAATTPSPPEKASQAVNGIKSSNGSSATVAETVKTEKLAQIATLSTDSLPPETAILKSSDVKAPDPSLSETSRAESKDPLTTAIPSPDDSSAYQSVLSQLEALESFKPDNRSWYKLRYSREERRAFARDKRAMRRGQMVQLHEVDEHHKRVSAKRTNRRAQSVLGRIGSVLSSLISPIVSKPESTASEANPLEQTATPSIDRAHPLPTVYREDEKFPYGELRADITTSKDISASHLASSESAKPVMADSTATKPISLTDTVTIKETMNPSAQIISEPPPVQETRSHLEPLTSAQLDTQLLTTQQISPIHFAVSPPRSTRPLVPSAPVSSSIYSASSLLLPGTPFLFPKPPNPSSHAMRAAITALSSSAPSNIRSPTDLVEHYEEEIVKRRPHGLSAEEMKGLFVAWVGIEKRSAEGLSDESVRRAMRMSLVKAEEIVEARTMEREKRMEEERAAKEVKAMLRKRERDVVLGLLGGTQAYPLTEPTSASTTTSTTDTKHAETPSLTHAALSTTGSTLQTEPTTKTAEKHDTSTFPKPDIPDSKPISERSQDGSVAQRSNGKNEESSRVAIKAKAILERRKRNVDRFAEKKLETKSSVDKSEASKPEENRSHNIESEKEYRIRAGETRTEMKPSNIKSDTAKSEEGTVLAETSENLESLKAEEATMDASGVIAQTERTKQGVEAPATELVAEKRDPPIPTNTIAKHTIATQSEPSHHELKTATSSRGVAERNPNKSSIHSPPSTSKNHAEHSSNTSSFFERVLAMTGTQSSESPVKRFIDLATETFDKNLKMLGVTDGEEKKENSTVSIGDEKEISPNTDTNQSASSSDKMSTIVDSKEPGHGPALNHDNEKSEKGKRAGEKEYHSSERRKMLKM